MRYKRLGRTELEASVLGFGSNRIWSFPQEALDYVFNYALDSGINWFVTSAAYGVAEGMIAKAIGHRRENFFIITTTDYRTAKRAKKDIENSFKIFDTDYIDIYMMGGVRKMETIDRIFKKGNVFSLMKDYQKEGRIGYIGITGHMPEALAKAMETGEMDVVLFIFNFAQIHALNDLIPFAQEHDTGLIAMQPLGHGYYGDIQKAFRFVLASPADVVVSGMYTREEIDEDISIAEAPPTEEEWESLFNEAISLDDTGCRQCRQCVGWYLRKSRCPANIDIPFVLNTMHYRDRYGLLLRGERKWKKESDKCANCTGDGRCEEICPYNLKIVDHIRKVASSQRRKSN